MSKWGLWETTTFVLFVVVATCGVYGVSAVAASVFEMAVGK